MRLMKVKHKKPECVVYWLRDSDCTDMKRHGYIGITANPKIREKEHRRSGRMPKDFEMIIVMEGRRDECLEREKHLRPEMRIGWNLAAGGINQSETSPDEAAVYWIKEKGHQDIANHGYVGVSNCPEKRLNRHLKRNQNVPNTGVELVIWYTGTREDCLEIESQLRPYRNIGWNRAPGGCIYKNKETSNASTN